MRSKLQLALHEIKHFENIEGRYACAIDPGTSGGMIVVAHEHGTIAYRSSLPLKDKEVDFYALKAMIEEIENTYSPTWVVEKVGYIRGHRVAKAANAAFAKAIGTIETTMCCLGLDFLHVKPEVWQLEMFRGIEKVYVKRKVKTVHDTKATANKAARTKYPDVDLTKSDAAKKDDHNVTDAFLMCMWALKQEVA